MNALRLRRARNRGRSRFLSRGPEAGVASIEIVALTPLLVLVTIMTLQGGAAVWTVTATDNAARQAARAEALGQDPRQAAEAALPSGLVLERISHFGPDHGIVVVVRIPRVSPLPQMTVTRSAELPSRQVAPE